MQAPIPISVVTDDSYPDWLSQQPAETQQWLQQTRFKPSAGSVSAIPGRDGSIDRIVCAVGQQADTFSLASLAKRFQGHQLALDDWNQPFAESMALGYLIACYSFDRYRSEEARFAELVIPDQEMAQRLQQIAKSIHWVRDLVNTPAEDMGPPQLAQEALQLAEEFGADFQQIVGQELLDQSYPAIHAVGRAADREPRLLQLSWGDLSRPKLVLVGKGVCFDTGGLNLKMGNYMLLMKKDMGGGAHALGLARMIMSSKLPVRLEVLIPTVENNVAGNAYRPGDVINTRAGVTVEIGNTDAEGRVVMSDALTRAIEMEPDLILDFATLTGAARVALGPELPVMFSNNQQVAEELLSCAEQAEDPLWQLPLYAPYKKMLSSKIADINNSASGPMAGCITAALFLQRFVEADVDWCHLDVFAWNPGNRPGRPQGGEAQGLRGYLAYLKKRYQGQA